MGAKWYLYVRWYSCNLCCNIFSDIIASYFRQISADIKMKNSEIKPVLSHPANQIGSILWFLFQYSFSLGLGVNPADNTGNNYFCWSWIILYSYILNFCRQPAGVLHGVEQEHEPVALSHVHDRVHPEDQRHPPHQDCPLRAGGCAVSPLLQVVQEQAEHARAC